MSGIDVRPAWRRRLNPRRTWHRPALAVWFAVATAATMAAEVAYGWRAPPIDHAPALVAYLLLAAWVVVAGRWWR